MIHVIICDDHPVVREGVRVVLNDWKDVVLVDEASNGQALLEKIRKRSFDVIILDISFPEGQDGLELLKEIKATVGTYRMRIMGKLSLKNNADLVRYALRNSLID